MKPINIISACNSSNLGIQDSKLVEGFDLKEYESRTLAKFIDILKTMQISSKCFNGFFISYSIKQISKEFDLLRFGKELVINIELKASLEEDIKVDKIKAQMNHNYYYLKFLSIELAMYTYVEDDGLYMFNYATGEVKRVDYSHLVANLNRQTVDFSINLDDVFLPKNYLVSTFNDTDRFLQGEYFLTDHQYNIRKEVLEDIASKRYNVYCIPANAGTGKTLLAYDIVKHVISNNNSVRVIHVGKLNSGQYKLNSLGWLIHSIREINSWFFSQLVPSNIDIIMVDESQRISLFQLDLILQFSLNNCIPVVFMYDTKQFLKFGETTDIHDYIKDKYKTIPIQRRKLSNKIRTNKDLASFISNLVHIGSSKSDLNYNAITIEYFEHIDDVGNYIDDIVEHEGWKAITFSNSLRNADPLDDIANLCDCNAHDVIGQEFEKVVFVMDNNFRYDVDGRLAARRTFYSAKGMLYQIVTRVVKDLKIVVLGNRPLFEKLLGIKYCTFIED